MGRDSHFTKCKGPKNMPIMDESVWQEIAKWFAGIAASIATLLMLIVRGWSADRFSQVDKRLNAHDEAIKKHSDQLTEQHEALVVLMERVDTGKEDRQKIQEGVNRINEKIDRLVERC